MKRTALAAALLLAACAPAPSGAALWSKGFGAIGVEADPVLVAGASGALGLAGTYARKLDLGGGALASDGSRDAWVAVLGPDGSHRWSRGAWGSAPRFGLGVALDAQDRAYLGGDFSGTVDLGDGLLTALAQDTFVAAFDARGATRWTRHFSADDGGPVGGGLAVDHAGNLVFAGTFSGTIGFGGPPLEPGAIDRATRHGFVASLDDTGAHRFSLSLGGRDNGVAAIAVDAADDVLVAGVNGGTVTLGGQSLTHGDLSTGDGFVAKLGPGGEARWLMGIQADAGAVSPHAVAAGPQGGALVVGEYAGTLLVGPLRSRDLTGPLAFVLAVSAAGEPRWLRTFGDPGARATSVAVDAHGHTYVAGGYAGKPRVGALELPERKTDTPFLIELDGDGITVAAHGFGVEGHDSHAGALAVAPDGEVVIAGLFHGAVEPGGSRLAGKHGANLFVAAVAP